MMRVLFFFGSKREGKSKPKKKRRNRGRESKRERRRQRGNKYSIKSNKNNNYETKCEFHNVHNFVIIVAIFSCCLLLHSLLFATWFFYAFCFHFIFARSLRNVNKLGIYRGKRMKKQQERGTKKNWHLNFSSRLFESARGWMGYETMATLAARLKATHNSDFLIKSYYYTFDKQNTRPNFLISSRLLAAPAHSFLVRSLCVARFLSVSRYWHHLQC